MADVTVAPLNGSGTGFMMRELNKRLTFGFLSVLYERAVFGLLFLTSVLNYTDLLIGCLQFSGSTASVSSVIMLRVSFFLKNQC